MKPIKVTHITNVDVENYYLNNMVDYTDPNETEFSFITFAGSDCGFVREMKKRGKKVYSLDITSRKRYPQAFRQISRILNEINPDIIHTHLFDPTVIGLTVAKLQKRKALLTRHHSDALYEINSFAKRKFYLGLENYINRKADHIIAPSQMVSDILMKRENVAEKKISIIPYGQTNERFDSVTEEKIKAVKSELNMNHNLSLTFVSRLFHRKGHEYLFKAFSDLVKNGLDATLYLVGDGDYQVVLEKIAADLKIENNVKFLGWRNDALAIIAASDIIVHPSLEDALSSAVIESLMLGKPIVATDISGVRDSLDNGKYGKIVPPADAESFHDALQETIENLDLAVQKAKEGRKYLLEYMDAERVALEHVSLYKVLLSET